jgi:hypothetical protein
VPAGTCTAAEDVRGDFLVSRVVVGGVVVGGVVVGGMVVLTDDRDVGRLDVRGLDVVWAADLDFDRVVAGLVTDVIVGPLAVTDEVGEALDDRAVRPALLQAVVSETSATTVVTTRHEIRCPRCNATAELYARPSVTVDRESPQSRHQSA